MTNSNDRDVIGVVLEDLVEGKVFDKSELILVRVKDKMMTITQSGPGEVMCVYYDINLKGKSVRDSGNGYEQLTESDRGSYDLFRQKLLEAKLWQ